MATSVSNTVTNVPCANWPYNIQPGGAFVRPSEMMKPLLPAIFVLLVLELPAVAQDARVTATVDQQEISIGDWITLHVEVTGASGAQIGWPSFSEVLKGFEIVREGKAVTKAVEKEEITSVDVVLTAFEEGKLTIPELPIQYTAPGAMNPQTLQSKPVTISVRGIQVDLKDDIKDIKPPVKVPVTFREALPYILAAAGAALLICGVIYILRKRKRGEKIIPPAPPRPPLEIALEALRQLDAEQLWQQGQDKEYQARLSDIVRAYIERAFVIPAMEMTTNQILIADPVQTWNTELREKLSEILERSDLVKFAKYRPLAEEHRSSMDSAVWFVESADRTLRKQQLAAASTAAAAV